MEKIIRKLEYGEGIKLHYIGGNSVNGKSLSTENMLEKINELVDKVNELEQRLSVNAKMEVTGESNIKR